MSVLLVVVVRSISDIGAVTWPDGESALVVHPTKYVPNQRRWSVISQYRELVNRPPWEVDEEQELAI